MSNQKGVLIKDADGNVIEKRVYGGDTSGLLATLNKEGVTYFVYNDDDPLFVNAVLPPPPPSLDERVQALEIAVALVAEKTNTVVTLSPGVKNG